MTDLCAHPGKDTLIYMCAGITCWCSYVNDPPARRMEKAGTAVTYLNYPTLIHGFLQWSGVVEDAERAAVELARLFGNAIRTRRAVLRVDPFK